MSMIADIFVELGRKSPVFVVCAPWARSTGAS